jgi:predicted transposase/invertase (TIGR01784 family)
MRWTLDPKVDLVFSLLFGAEQNRGLLIQLLHDVLQPSSPIVSVEVLPPRPEPAELEEKPVFLDLRLRIASGEQIDVEMQTRRHVALRSRILFYWGRMYTSQLQRGAPYSELQRCAVILIADFVELECTDFHSVFQARERARNDLLTDHLELHLLELPKLENAPPRADEPELAAWCRFLSADTDEQLEALAMQYPILKDAKEALEQLSADPDARERAARREIELKLYEYGIRTIRAEGRAEGRGRRVLARLLTLKFGTLSPELGARLAEASNAEIELWTERILTVDTLDGIFAR